MIEGSPARVGTKWSEREKGGVHAPGDSKGHSPWRAFGDFPRVGKVTRGGGAERPPHRGVQRGLRPLASSGPGSEGRSALLMGAGTGVLQKFLGVEGRSACILGSAEGQSPSHPGESCSGSEGRSALHLRDCAPRIKTKTILDSSAGLRYTEKKENRRNHHVRKKTGPQRSLLVRQPEKI